MTILDIKKNIETFFNDNYSETAIHWAGTKFDTGVLPEWVYIEYTGATVNDLGLDNTQYEHRGAINLTIVAKTSFRVNEIATLLIDLFKGRNIDGIFIRGTAIIEQAVDSSLDKSYMILATDTSSK